MYKLWKGRAGERTEGEGLAAAMTWANFEDAIARCDAVKGVGVDGFNAHLLKHAPVGVRKAYWQALAEMLHTLTFPPEYK